MQLEHVAATGRLCLETSGGEKRTQQRQLSLARRKLQRMGFRPSTKAHATNILYHPIKGIVADLRPITSGRNAKPVFQALSPNASLEGPHLQAHTIDHRNDLDNRRQPAVKEITLNLDDAEKGEN